MPGSAGVLTAGSFDGSHAYADNGQYTVTVTVADDDGGMDTKTFVVNVGNIPPTLTVVGNQVTTEGAVLEIIDLGTFTDPGFGPTETFTYTIDWGDGSPHDSGGATIDVPGSAGVLTAGSFDGSTPTPTTASTPSRSRWVTTTTAWTPRPLLSTWETSLPC